MDDATRFKREQFQLEKHGIRKGCGDDENKSGPYAQRFATAAVCRWEIVGKNGREPAGTFGPHSHLVSHSALDRRVRKYFHLDRWMASASEKIQIFKSGNG